MTLINKLRDVLDKAERQGFTYHEAPHRPHRYWLPGMFGRPPRVWWFDETEVTAHGTIHRFKPDVDDDSDYYESCGCGINTDHPPSPLGWPVAESPELSR